MSLGWQILLHALSMLWRNLGAALRLSVGPALLAAGFMVLVLGLGGGVMAAFEPASRAAGLAGLGLLAGLMLGVLAAFVAMLWIAVGWHRYVLLQEPVQGIFPPLRGDAMAGYLGRSIVIAVITLVVVALVGGALGLALGAVTTPGQGWERPGLALVWSGALGLVATVIGYRLGPMLPASAIGAPIGIAAAWRATRGANLAFVALAVLTVLLSGLVQAVGTALLALWAPLGMVWNLAAGWASGMIAISLLTTLHGHFVQGRPLG